MEWITAEAACARLGIKRASLYAYVSRGRVKARVSEDDPRASLYAASDIDGLLKQRKLGRKRSDIAKGAIGWGEPVMVSAIATVQNGRLIYRGQDAVQLSDALTLEAVAGLLWGSEALFEGQTKLLDGPGAPTSKAAGFAFLAGAAAIALPSRGRSPAQHRLEAESLLSGLATHMAHSDAGAYVHERLAHAWGLNSAQADIVRRALVLLADHELNPSTFAARVAASTGASLAASCLAGYATLTGPGHGEAAIRCLDYLTFAHSYGPKAAVADVLERGQAVPGLGHMLYPDGDPRAASLIAALRPYPLIADTIAIAEETWAGAVNIDMALAALTLQLRLPRDAPFMLFAVARMAGWLAHAREQLKSGAPIRPRATYNGVSLTSEKYEVFHS